MYYKLIKEWDNCFHEFDLALSSCQGAEPFHENSILKMKAEAMLEAGRYEEAANIYKTATLKGDSLNQDMLQRHEEVYQANYKSKSVIRQGTADQTISLDIRRSLCHHTDPHAPCHHTCLSHSPTITSFGGRKPTSIKNDSSSR